MSGELTSDQMYDAASKLKEAGDLAGAVAALLKIIDVDKDHLHTNMALGVFMQKLDRIEEAIKYAVRVTEIQPEDPFSFTQLSVIYQRCGKIPEAEDAMAKAHVLQGRQPAQGSQKTASTPPTASSQQADSVETPRIPGRSASKQTNKQIRSALIHALACASC